MGWGMQWFGRPSVFNRRGKLTMVSDGEAGTRTNILAASVEDEQRRRDRSPAPVVGWRFRNGGWLRWSELDGDYVQRPVPASLVRYGESIGGPPEEHVVAMVDGEWREVSDGAAPLRWDVTAPPAPPAEPAPEPEPPVISEPAVPPEPSFEFEEQLAAWRSRNRKRR